MEFLIGAIIGAIITFIVCKKPNENQATYPENTKPIIQKSSVFEFTKEPAALKNKNDNLRMINGTIKNTSGKTFTDITISFDLYNSNGKFIDTEYAFFDEEKLFSGEEWDFCAAISKRNAKTFKLTSVEVKFSFEENKKTDDEFDDFEDFEEEDDDDENKNNKNNENDDIIMLGLQGASEYAKYFYPNLYK